MAITSRRELEQLHGKLKKNPGLDRTLTLGHAIGLHSAVPLSYQAIREPFIFELVFHLPGAILIVIYLTFHILSVLFTSLVGNSKQPWNRSPSGRLGGSVAEQSSMQLHGPEFGFCSRLFLFRFSLQLLYLFPWLQWSLEDHSGVLRGGGIFKY